LRAAGQETLLPGAEASGQQAAPVAAPPADQAAALGESVAIPPVKQAYDERRFQRRMSGEETCLACHSSYNFVKRLPDGSTRSLWLDSDEFHKSVHAQFTCQTCHTNIDVSGHRLVSMDVAAQRTDEITKEKGNGGATEPAPEAQELKLGEDFTITVALDACLHCHPREYELYKNSVHGEARLSGKNPDAPFCIDCHGSHYILPKDNDFSRTNPANIPSTCLECHDQKNIKIRAGLERDVGESFKESFHGKRGQLGGIEVAVCNTCHGTHDIYRPSDPRSMVNRERIAKTCGRCHDGAQLNFASAFTHSTVSPTEQLGLYIMKQVYKWVIFLLIAQFILFAGLDIYRHVRAGRLKPLGGKQSGAVNLLEGTGGAQAVGQPRGRARIYERFNIHHRIQHFIMAFSFTALVVTGWPLRFPELRASQLASAIVGGVDSIGIIHRCFGVMLIVVSIYHIVYLVLQFVRGKRSVAILPSIVDAKEALGDILYWFGLRPHRPRFSRYNWIEKVEYYAVVWGTAVMILSGAVIWVPTFATKALPAWVVSASVIFHGYEALLAGLAIFLWHFYWVHLHPEVYPMSTVWLSGKLTEEQMEHHHPRELEMLQQRSGANADATGPAASGANGPGEGDQP
jgi:cytochrome b subunit of formate dehydrogenase